MRDDTSVFGFRCATRIWLVICALAFVLTAPTNAQDDSDATEPVVDDAAAVDDEGFEIIDDDDDFFDDDFGADDDFGDLSLEELMTIEVTSVTGVAESIASSPAAVYVITSEDIRRGGHRTIADALRMVPGLHVGQISSNTWAVSSRGFNGRFTDMLLVMIDGRAVYTPLFAGVFWDMQDVVLQDINQIEVIRGPGATLWGANAVNGVINIVTKHSRDTQGLLLSSGGGTEETAFGTVRYGWQAADNAWARVYLKYDSRDGAVSPAGVDIGDDWRTVRSGFRLDLDGNDGMSFRLQGDYFNGHHGQLFTIPQLTFPFVTSAVQDLRRTGGNIVARLDKKINETTGWSVRGYLDVDRLEYSSLTDDRRTLDLEFRQHLDLDESNHLIWGVGFRQNSENSTGSFALSFTPASRDFDKYSAFIQDQIDLSDDVRLVVGSKFEHNDFTGFEVQPSARISYTPDDNQTLWGSVSRAVRTPSRVESDVALTVGIVPPPTGPAPVRFVGNNNVESEELIAYEMGYRVRPSDVVTLDIAAFYNDYDSLTSTDLVIDPITTAFRNGGSAESYGVEVSTQWQPAPNWRIAASYAWIELNMHATDETAEGDVAEQQFRLRSYLDVTDDVELNAATYFVDTLSNQGADDHVRLDVGLTWRPQHNVEIAVWGQNLLDSHNLEFTDPFLTGAPIEIERGVYGQVTIRF